MVGEDDDAEDDEPADDDDDDILGLGGADDDEDDDAAGDDVDPVGFGGLLGGDLFAGLFDDAPTTKKPKKPVVEAVVAPGKDVKQPTVNRVRRRPNSSTKTNVVAAQSTPAEDAASVPNVAATEETAPVVAKIEEAVPAVAKVEEAVQAESDAQSV